MVYEVKKTPKQLDTKRDCLWDLEVLSHLILLNLACPERKTFAPCGRIGPQNIVDSYFHNCTFSYGNVLVLLKICSAQMCQQGYKKVYHKSIRNVRACPERKEFVPYGSRFFSLRIGSQNIRDSYFHNSTVSNGSMFPLKSVPPKCDVSRSI